MSSTFSLTTPEPGGTAESPDVSRIPYFDATVLRKEKMRRKASQQGLRGGKPAGNGHPAASTVSASTPPASTVSASVEPDVSSSNFSNSAQSGSTGAVSAQSAAASPRISGEALERYLIDFVVEQTGYPSEMVELDADLEADLGIDSIKKAQLFGELANEFDVKASDDLSLDDFLTLRHVKDYLETTSGTTASTVDAIERTDPVPPSPATVSPSVSATSPSAVSPLAPSPESTDSAAVLCGTALEQFLINFVVEQTGYPPEMVELDADLEADLGIDSIKKAQLFGELANDFEIQTSDDLSLDDYTTLRHVKEFLESAAPQESVSSIGSPAIPPASIAAVEEPRQTPVQVSVSSSSSILSGVELELFLVNFVVEQTGYPPEMVELDADLEADLGIDSIKKAQLFGELANDFEIQTSDDLSLDEFPTLRHVKAFLENAQGLQNAQRLNSA